MNAKNFLLLLAFSCLNILSFKAQNIEDAKLKLASDIRTLQNSDWKGMLAPNLSKTLSELLDTIYGKDLVFKNGKTFSRYFGIAGSPFLYPDPLSGNISINSLNHEMMLLYDIYRDQVICKVENSIGNYNTLIINNLIVNSFSFHDKQFINYPNLIGLLSGYYELIYKGKEFSVLAKWYKTRVVSTTVNQIDFFSDAERQIILVKGTETAKVRNAKDFINFIGISKSEAKKKYKRKLPKFPIASNAELIDFSRCFDIIN